MQDDIAEITVDRAPVNAISMTLIDELLAALDEAKWDEVVRAVIVTSAHQVFCAGLDLDLVRENVAETFALIATTKDCQEGLAAFVEKRAPSYRGGWHTLIILARQRLG